MSNQWIFHHLNQSSKVGRRRSAIKARQNIRLQSETTQTKKRWEREKEESNQIKALQKEVKSLITKVEQEKDDILDQLHKDLDEDEDTDEDDDIDDDDDSDDRASEIIRDVIELNSIHNKLAFNRLVMNVESVRNQTRKKFFKGKEVLIDIGNKRFVIHNPPSPLSNDFLSLMSLFGVAVEKETEEQGV